MIRSRIVLAAMTALLVVAVGAWVAGELLSRPEAHVVGDAPASLPTARTVRIEYAGDQFVVGWFVRGASSRGGVLLLHGIRSDRTQMIKRAQFLTAAGYSVLLIDLPAHGESTGSRITFGARESAGVGAAVMYLRRELQEQRLAIIGVSLGAASTVLSELRPAPEAVIIESMYPTIEEAVADRLKMRLGPMGNELAPLLLWQIPLRSGVQLSDLHPIEKLPSLGSPVLVVSGAEDQHTKWHETLRLYEAAKPPKEIWQVKDAAHVDLHAFAPHQYEEKILMFLGKYLRNEDKAQ